MDRAWADAHADFLSSLSPEETDALLDCARVVELAQRDLLFGAGDPSDTVYIIGSGCIKLYQLSPGGKEIILWFSFKGEIFGVAELLTGADREIYAQANVDSEVLAVSQKDFLDFLRAHPEASMRAIGILSSRVRTLGSVLVDLATDDVETRLSRLLLRFAALAAHSPCGLKRDDGEVCLNVRLTHQDIANVIGASRQTVTSTLAVMRRNGVIRTLDQHIHIVRPENLRRVVEPINV